MPFVKCLRTACPQHAQQHFEYLRGEDRFRCCASFLLLKRRSRQHLVFDCLRDKLKGGSSEVT